MRHLLEPLRIHFEPLDDRMESFVRHGVQIEGWFKGELLVAFDALVDQGIVEGFDREVRNGRRRIDLTIESNGMHWVELKHWLIGEQKGVHYGPGSYFRDKSSVGVVKDVEKLLTVSGDMDRWLLLLLTSNPGSLDW